MTICLIKRKSLISYTIIDPYYEAMISPIIFSEFESKKNKGLESPFIIKVEKEGIDL